MQNLFSGLNLAKAIGRRERMNPKPPIPETGWTVPKKFPNLSNEESLCVDVETYDPGLDPSQDRGPGWGRGEGFIVGIAVGAGRHGRYYFPMRHKEEAQDNMNPKEVIHYVKELMHDPRQLKVGFNLMYDVGWLAQEGITVHGNLFCVQTVEKQLFNSTQESFDNSLGSVAYRHLDGAGKTSEDLCRWLWDYYGKGGNPSSDQLRGMRKFIYRTPPRLCGPYAMGDVDLPLRIMEVQRPLIEQNGLETVCNLENALIPLIVAMRMRGVSIDEEAAHRADEGLTVEIDRIQKEINHMVGKTINTGSPIELGKAFQSAGIRLPLTATGKPCVKAEILKKITHPLAQKVIEIQGTKKFRDDFVRSAILESHVHGIVRGEFLPLTTITGRWSCRHPNLQQIPSRGDIAKMIRAIFVARKVTPSSHWRKYDYASIEARLLAHFAVGPGSKELRYEYNNNPYSLGLTTDRKQDTDYHNFTQKMIRDLMGLEVERKHVKNINFACIYGAQDKKLASMLGLEEEEGTRFMEAYHGALRYIKTTMGHVSKVVQDQGETRTVLGRRVLFDSWVPSTRGDPGAPRPTPLPLETAYELWGSQLKRADSYKGLNYLIQGSAADLMKAAMVMCWEQGIFDVTGIPGMTVHDELDFEVEEHTPARHEAFREMVNIMETAIPFKVPVRVDGEWGMNWSELEPIE